MPHHYLAEDEIQDAIVDSGNNSWQLLDLVFRDVVDPQHERFFREAVKLHGLDRYGGSDHHVVVVGPFEAPQLFFSDAHITDYFAVSDSGHEDDARVAVGTYICDARTIGRERNVFDVGQAAIHSDRRRLSSLRGEGAQ